MSHLSQIFTQTPVEIPNKSGFDMSFENLLTMKVGTLVPVVTEELLPGDSYSLGFMANITLPPMATDFYGRVDMRLEAFFVPYRICWGGWERFITLPVSNPFSNNIVRRDVLVPHAFISYTSSDSDDMSTVFGAGSLSDYLGNKIVGFLSSSNSGSSTTFYYNIPNLLPYVAYHKIYDDWYRNSLIQTPLFGNPASASTTAGHLSALPYETSYSTTSSSSSQSYTWAIGDIITLSGFDATSTSQVENSALADGYSVFALRQRNWAKDYFQTAHLYPQSNDSVSGIEVDSSDGSFTIPDLRAANVVQRWIERNNIAGTRYADQIKATFGVSPSDAVLDRPIFIGSSKFGIYNKSVYNQTGVSDSTSNNVFGNSLAGEGAASKGMGKSSLIDNFTATEHGYIMVLASIVPHQYYSTGTRRYLARINPADFANPLLQGLGEQPIHNWELSNDWSSGLGSFWSTSGSIDVGDSSLAEYTASDTSIIYSSASLFGYTQQYAEYKYHDDEVHGLLRDGENLQYFALQTSYDIPELSSEFLQIPTDYMDNVTAVSSTLSQYGAWADFYFNAKKISTLAEYVIPTLGDLKNTHKENIPYNGTML